MAQNENNIKIEKMIVSTMKSLNSMIDVNTVIGKPIYDDKGKMILPVSKVTVGFVAGGGDYGEIKLFQQNKNLPFAGGSGAVISIKPSGFFIKEENNYKFIKTESDVYEKITDSAIDLIRKATNDEEI